MNKTDKRIAAASKRIHTYIDNLWNEYFSRREAEKTIDTYKQTGQFYVDTNPSKYVPLTYNDIEKYYWIK